MLVKMSWIHGVPSVQLCNGAEMDKPVHLYGLPISTWGMCRNPSADFRYFFQFLFAFRIGFSSSHLFGQFSMAFGKMIAASQEMDMAVSSSCLSVASGSFMKSRFLSSWQYVLSDPACHIDKLFRPRKYDRGLVVP